MLLKILRILCTGKCLNCGEGGSISIDGMRQSLCLEPSTTCLVDRGLSPLESTADDESRYYACNLSVPLGQAACFCVLFIPPKTSPGVQRVFIQKKSQKLSLPFEIWGTSAYQIEALLCPFSLKPHFKDQTKSRSSCSISLISENLSCCVKGPRFLPSQIASEEDKAFLIK